MAFDLTNIEKRKKKDAKEAYSFESLLKKEIQLFGAFFSNKKKEAFYTELSVLLGAGITLKDTLVLISEEQKKEQDRKLIETITNHLIKGSSLSEAIKKQKDFTEYEYYSIKIGEETGNLEKVCEELGAFYKRRNSQRRTILNALSYPIIVISTAILAVVFMLQFVVPMFVDIFKQNKVELPWITKIIITASEKLNQNF
ncbi:type II secretion system F family protein [uncultured Lutibacter sp.]|uniref:type II secretion system F family protein n=1 Tax=uncultured Lutibacter sp. TaxID=437739 RepID=UPI002614D82E|nr:type II secretion system F family protein [uncultured Lutibacter sp.]